MASPQTSPLQHLRTAFNSFLCICQAQASLPGRMNRPPVLIVSMQIITHPAVFFVFHCFLSIWDNLAFFSLKNPKNTPVFVFSRFFQTEWYSYLVTSEKSNNIHIRIRIHQNTIRPPLVGYMSFFLKLKQWHFNTALWMNRLRKQMIAMQILARASVTRPANKKGHTTKWHPWPSGMNTEQPSPSGMKSLGSSFFCWDTEWRSPLQKCLLEIYNQKAMPSFMLPVGCTLHKNNFTLISAPGVPSGSTYL